MSNTYTIIGNIALCDYWKEHQHRDANERYLQCVEEYHKERLITQGEVAKINPGMTFFKSRDTPTPSRE